MALYKNYYNDTDPDAAAVLEQQIADGVIAPGIRLLAHGVPARVGKLRAYGNAIVPALAAEVIGAYLDAERIAA